MKKFKKLLIISFISIFMTACGGGGGGGDDGGIGIAGGFIDPASCVLPVSLIAITAANAEAVVSEVKGAIQTALAFANANSDLIVLNNLMLPSNPVTLACDTSGSFTTTLTGTNPISMNDQLALDFSSCQDTGTTLNGVLTATYNTITEVVAGEAGNVSSANDWDFSISSISNDLQVEDSNIDVAADGVMVADIDFNAAGVNLVSTATNTNLTYADRGGECTSIDLIFFVSTAMNVTTNPATYSLSINEPANAGAFTIASTELGGVVAISTNTTPFIGMENLFDAGQGEVDEYFVELDDSSPPTSGSLFIQSGTSSATVTAMPGGVVQIDVDIDLDGVIDDTFMTTWAAL